MRLLFLGSGSAHTAEPDNFQSNMMLIAASGRRLLIDCGSDIRWSLARQRLSYRDVTDIYISHLHADHIGGLEHIAFQTKFDPSCSKPRLYIERSLVQALWEHSLRGGLGIVNAGETTLDEFFDVNVIEAGTPFAWEDASLTAVPTLHVSAPGMHVVSHALHIAEERQTFLTTDTQFLPEYLAPWYQESDLIFHDCEIGAVRSGVHSHYDDLKDLPAALRAKMWLYDYPAGPLPDCCADGFRGFVRAGQAFDLR